MSPETYNKLKMEYGEEFASSMMEEEDMEKWTPSEIDILKQGHAGGLTIEALKERLPGRSAKSIRVKKSKLGLTLVARKKDRAGRPPSAPKPNAEKCLDPAGAIADSRPALNMSPEFAAVRQINSVLKGFSARVAREILDFLYECNEDRQ